MSLRKIIRPETETHFLEFSFHWCKTLLEYENATRGVSEEDIITIMMSVNPQTFSLVKYFAVREKGKSFSEWLKYGIDLSLFPAKST